MRFFGLLAVLGTLLAACGTSQSLPATPHTPAAAAPSRPAAALEQGLTPAGQHVLGSPSAPVTLVEYSDYL